MSQLSRFIISHLLMFIVLSPLALAQVADSTEPPFAGVMDENLHSLILKVRSSNYDPFTGQSAIPELKQAFVNTPDHVIKENVANVLMHLGQRDEIYWAVLYERAQEIVDSSIPFPLVYDESGKERQKTLSPEFLEWVKDHDKSEEQAFYEQLGLFPVELSFMADIGDPRGLSLLRKGLMSLNYGVRKEAAVGLALLQDRDSISAIIEAAETTPKQEQWMVALPLTAFDDSRARAEVEKLVSDKKLLESVKQRVQARGARGL